MKTEPTQLIHSFNHTENTEGNFNGLTKREHFAAIAMQALINGVISTGTYTIADINQGACCDIATVAVVCADQLIVELNQPTK